MRLEKNWKLTHERRELGQLAGNVVKVACLLARFGLRKVLFKSHVLELMGHCPESIRKPLLPFLAVDLFLSTVVKRCLLFEPFGNENALVAREFWLEGAAVLDVGGVSFGNRLVDKDAVGECELVRSQWAEKFLELCRSAGVSVGGAGRIRRLFAAKLITDLARSLRMFFLGGFLFFTLNGRLKMRH